MSAATPEPGHVGTEHPPQGHGPPRRRAAKPLRWGGFALAGVVVVVAIVKSGVVGPAGPPLPPSAPVVDVTMREYQYDYHKPTKAGRTVFRVHNAGHLGHHFGVALLPDDMPPIDVQIKGTVRRNIDFIIDVPQAREDIPPGGSLAVALDVQPGQRYAFLCFIRNQDDAPTHAELGMSSEFRVAGQAPTTAAPVP